MPFLLAEASEKMKKGSLGNLQSPLVTVTQMKRGPNVSFKEARKQLQKSYDPSVRLTWLGVMARGKVGRCV